MESMVPNYFFANIYLKLFHSIVKYNAKKYFIRIIPAIQREIELLQFLQE